MLLMLCVILCGAEMLCNRRIKRHPLWWSTQKWPWHS